MIVGNIPSHRIVLFAKTRTLIPRLEDVINSASFSIRNIGYFMFTAKSPEPFCDKNIMVFHGKNDGTLPPISRKALEIYGDRVDFIFCCHPKSVKRVTGDPRIQWSDSDSLLISSIQETENNIVISIKEQ